MFVLGGDEAELRNLFQPHVLEMFEGKKGMYLAGAGDTIVMYRHGKCVKPEEIESVLAEVYGLFGVFAESTVPAELVSV